MKRLLLLLIVASLLSACTAEREEPEKNLVIKTVFQYGDSIPKKYTCDGADVNPPIWVEGIDEGARSIAVIFDDPDAPSGVFTHWVAWNIPVTGKIPEDIPRKGEVSSPIKMVQGVNDFGKIGYGGPCPPEGEKHRYYLRVYVLDTTLNLKPGVSRGELERAMEGHVIQYGEYMGVYRRG